MFKSGTKNRHRHTNKAQQRLSQKPAVKEGMHLKGARKTNQPTPAMAGV